ncbi:MAG: thermostable hemolysin [Halothiobacillus sp.]
MIPQSSIFVEDNINPLLSDLTDPMYLQDVGFAHPDRPETQDFIRHVFHHAHGAALTAFYPNILKFSIDAHIRAAVGCRDGCSDGLFSAQYVDRPLHERAAECLGHSIAPSEMVEVGNLAISDPGQSRWVIAATTVFLAAAGYRWVLFTASTPLANAFKRLGLKPLALAAADPARLPDLGDSWGSYYAGHPQLYLGDIHAGLQKLQGLGSRRPHLHRLLGAAQRMGAEKVRKHGLAPAAAGG